MTEEIDVPGLRFVTRNVSAEDQAAVAVVLDALIAEESAEEHAVSSRQQTPWKKSQRAMRGTSAKRVDFGIDYTD